MDQQSLISRPGHGSRTFTFLAEDKHPLLIKLFEEYTDDYALFTWPAAPVLAQYVWFFAPMFRNKTVLEIGCGTALPGLTAAKLGAKVILADKFCSKSSQLLEQNIRENGMTVACDDTPFGTKDCVYLKSLTWGCTHPDLESLPQIDFVLASDCFYEEADFEDIVATLSYILLEKGGQNCSCLTSYQVRNAEWSIACILNQFGLKAKSLPLHEFDAASHQLLGSQLPGSHSISLFEITVK